MKRMLRRAFVQHALGATALATLPRVLPAAATRAGFRIFACDWTLQKTCNPAAFEVAAHLGLDGVQVDFGRPHSSERTLPLFAEAHQEAILAAAAAYKVPIASFAIKVSPTSMWPP